MQIRVYPRTESGSQVLIIPGRAAHLAPLLLSSGTHDQLKSQVKAALETVVAQATQLPFPE